MNYVKAPDFPTGGYIYGMSGVREAYLAKFINAYKSCSSRLIKKEYPSIKEKLYKEFFWSQSFCLLSTGGASIEVIKEYIETQGMKHDNKKSV